MNENDGCGLGKHEFNVDFTHKLLDHEQLEEDYDIEENPHRVYRQRTIRFEWMCKKCNFKIWADVPGTVIAAFGGTRDDIDRFS